MEVVVAIEGGGGGGGDVVSVVVDLSIVGVVVVEVAFAVLSFLYVSSKAAAT